MITELTLYHTQEYRPLKPLIAPIYAEGVQQWLGNGFYFWDDVDLAHWWGRDQKCRGKNQRGGYSIYKLTVQFEKDHLLDTVFNEDDYYLFVETIKEFADLYTQKFRQKPTFKRFNAFLQEHGVWEDIRVIRYQDMTNNNELSEVDGFYYKKRIQYRFKDLKFPFSFVHLEDQECKG